MNQLFICSRKSPCHHCAEKILPDDTQNGCRPTCKRWADFRADVDADNEKKYLCAVLTNMEFERIHIADKLWKRGKK